MNWKLAILSWLVAFNFGSGFVVRAGFPPKTDLLIRTSFDFLKW